MRQPCTVQALLNALLAAAIAVLKARALLPVMSLLLLLLVGNARGHPAQTLCTTDSECNATANCPQERAFPAHPFPAPCNPATSVCWRDFAYSVSGACVDLLNVTNCTSNNDCATNFAKCIYDGIGGGYTVDCTQAPHGPSCVYFIALNVSKCSTKDPAAGTASQCATAADCAGDAICKAAYDSFAPCRAHTCGPAACSYNQCHCDLSFGAVVPPTPTPPAPAPAAYDTDVKNLCIATLVLVAIILLMVAANVGRGAKNTPVAVLGDSQKTFQRLRI